MGHKNRKGHNKRKLRQAYDRKYPVAKMSFWQKLWVIMTGA